MGYQLKKDPDLPLPEYIEVRGQRYKTSELLPPERRTGPAPAGGNMMFRLCQPYQHWPAGWAKLAGPINVAQRSLNGDFYGHSMILAPAQFQHSPAQRVMTTLVPFVAVRQNFLKENAYWQFYFRTQAEMQQCLRESPDGQWLAAGHRMTLADRKPQDDKNNLLHTYRSRGQNRIQRNKRGGSQLVDPVPISNSGPNGHAVELEHGRPKTT
jgi:hypothetical protein